MRALRPVAPLPSQADGPSTARARTLQAAAGVGLLSMAAPAAYTVAPGDTLSEIARDEGVSVQALASVNGIDDPHRLMAGTTLEVPDAGSPEPAASSAEPATASEKVGALDTDVEALLEQAARDHGFSPRFVKALAWQESGWSQGTVSSAGAVGVMQVMPATGRHVADHILGRDLDLDDPRDNVAAGVAYLDHLWQRTGGDPEATLAGYYQGLGSVAEHGRFDDTERYIANVMALRDRF